MMGTTQFPLRYYQVHLIKLMLLYLKHKSFTIIKELDLR